MMSEIVNINWTVKKRDDYIKRLEDEVFDFVIIGGGVTGAGIAREAALRGIKTALIDKNDFAFGTSSRSSKLAHGGLRYFLHKDFGLIREATAERNWLRHHFSHNVRPVKINLPGLKHGKISPMLVKLAISIYDFLSNFRAKYKQYKPHTFLSPHELKEEEPHFHAPALEIMGQFYDTNVDDSRLTLETIKESIQMGDIVAVNYIQAKNFSLNNDGKIHAVNVVDIESGRKFSIRSSQVVNATGIWTDDLLENKEKRVIRPTKGVHILIPENRVGNHASFILFSIDDNRIFFVLNRNKFTLIGTTDTDYPLGDQGKVNEDLDLPYCTKEDCDYLFRTVNAFFPTAKIIYDDIISTYAGIRPLVMEPGKSEDDISRKHVILDSSNGLTSICGGKLTTFRKMAVDTLFHIIKKKGGIIHDGKPLWFPKDQLKEQFSKQPYLITLERSLWDQFIQNRSPDLSSNILDILYQQYGKGAMTIVNNVLENPELGTPFLENHPFIPAEIYYILAHEFALHLPDVMIRRTEISMKVKHTKQPIITGKVAEIMAEVYNWDEQTKNKEITQYLDHIAKTIWF
ncbi:MAG: glycerol-3-phosphate dehydrogenase/oxidase [Promethearchaeota archaeon]|nr:MAG: glycerol-3-phosphate dehydrogenase/oxidase [Candidatus Lokiarchaeota archaeon]